MTDTTTTPRAGETGLLAYVAAVHNPGRAGEQVVLLAPAGEPPLGPFEQSDRHVTYELVRRPEDRGGVFARPLSVPEGHVGPMMGGDYLATSDSRLGRAAGHRGAVPLHDRFETPAMHALLST